MKTRNLLRIVKPLFLIALTILIFSCGKKPDTIGLDLVDVNQAHVGHDTTLDVFAYSVLEDSVISDETTVNVIGSIQTETFGKTTASLYTHIRISDSDPDWGPNPVADSVVLYMVYDTAYGNINTQQTFNIYRVTEDFYGGDSVYYSNADFTIDEAQQLANYSFYPDLTKIEIVDTTGEENDTTYQAAILSIPINNWFADTIFNMNSSFLGTNDDFIGNFKGIYIKPDEVNATGEGSLLSFDLTAERSYMAIYFHNDTTNSLSYKFLINLNNARVGKYAHDYSLSQDQTFINEVINGDSTLGSQKLYLQGMGGVKTVIKVPGLEEWAGTGKIIVNDAQLQFKGYDYDENFSPPSTCYLFKFDKEGHFLITTDNSEGDNYYGGSLNSDNNSYWFRISLEAQKILNGDPSYGFVLFPAAKSIRANELVMPGTAADLPGHFVLKVTYTETQ